MKDQGEWAGLFSAAFVQSRNPMVLLDSRRIQVDVNGAYLNLLGYRRDQLIGQPIYRFVPDGPTLTDPEWKALLDTEQFTGEQKLLAADGTTIGVQFAATTEIVTGHRRVLFVALSTSRWGPRFRRNIQPARESEKLSRREYDVVRLVALGRTGPGDRRGAGDRPQHRPDPHPQRHGEARRPLAHSSSPRLSAKASSWTEGARERRVVSVARYTMAWRAS